MAEKVLMIALSPTMEEGTIVRWNKAEGDAMATGDLLCEVETDKATMEYEAQSSGTLLKILVPAGSQAKVADPIAIVGKPGEDISDLLEQTKPQPQARPVAPAAAAAPPPPRGQATAASQPPRTPTAATAPAPAGAVRASPLARKLASERGIEIAAVAGTGPAGRVVARDVDGGRSRPAAAASAPAAAARRAAASADQVVPVTGKRKVIAQRLVESKFQAPHYYLRISFEMDSLMAARARLNDRRKDKVSLNAFFHKLVAEALLRHPGVNASWQGDTIRQFGSIDIGLAVALPDGLITPVVRDCGSKGILEIDAGLAALIEKARAGRLTPEEFTGATFTISNLGSFGVEEFTAIINPPGSAILALGRIAKTPVVAADGTIVARSLLKATLSCDHRVIDGAAGAAFLADLKEIIENPLAAMY